MASIVFKLILLLVLKLDKQEEKQEKEMMDEREKYLQERPEFVSGGW